MSSSPCANADASWESDRVELLAVTAVNIFGRARGEGGQMCQQHPSLMGSYGLGCPAWLPIATAAAESLSPEDGWAEAVSFIINAVVCRFSDYKLSTLQILSIFRPIWTYIWLLVLPCKHVCL